jgi:Glycosyl hydrolase family 65, C-terminal domain
MLVQELADVVVCRDDRRLSTLPDALQAYSQIAAAAAFRRPAVLLDFDGTLAGIVHEPDAGELWPEELGALAFPFRYRGHRLHLEVNGRRAKVSSDSEQANVVEIECRGRVERLMPGHTVEFS